MATMVTMQDVAEYAGVSKATVSRVLNNDPSVAEALRHSVLKAIDTLGYQPNRAARRLRASSSDVIGLLISDIQNPFFVSVIEGVEDAAYASQMSVLLCNTAEDLTRQELYLRVMQAEQVAGLILVPTAHTDSKSLRRLSQSGMPIILLDRRVPEFDADLVEVDNRRGAYEAVLHLVALGYRRVALIAGSPTLMTSPSRQQGYVDALHEAGLAVDPALIRAADSQREGGYQAARDLMALPERPDAIFVGNNVMTLGALQALRELGVRVPEDVAIVGFDDMPWSGELSPPLTAVSQPTYDLGREAVHLLLQRLKEPTAAYRTVTLQTTFIVRESCGTRLRSG